MVNGRAVTAAAAVALWLTTIPPAGAAAEQERWLGDELPLPLPVKTPRDITFKAAAERQYLIFNLMASGKLAYQRGEYSVAVEKWETLLRVSGLDPCQPFKSVIGAAVVHNKDFVGAAPPFQLPSELLIELIERLRLVPDRNDDAQFDHRSRLGVTDASV